MTQPLVTNAANEEQVEEARLKGKIGQKNDLADLRAALSVPAVRRVFAPYIKVIDRACFDANDRIEAFKLGEQNMCKKLKQSLEEADPEAFELMMKEHKEKSK